MTSANPHSPEVGQFEEEYRRLDCRHVTKRKLKAARLALDDLVTRVRMVARTTGTATNTAGADDCLLRSLAAEQPDLLEDDTLVENIVAMVQSGSEDVAGLMLWMWKYLSDYPEWQERLAARNDDELSPGPVADWILCETLRMDQSEYLKRTARETFEFGGYTIPRGWNVRLCVRESHRDPAVFDDPERFAPERFADKTRVPQGYAPFGIGRTSCVGQRLTHVVACTFFTELAARMTWTVVGDGPRSHDGCHWTPNRAFRVRLQSRPSRVVGSDDASRTPDPCPHRGDLQRDGIVSG